MVLIIMMLLRENKYNILVAFTERIRMIQIMEVEVLQGLTQLPLDLMQ